MRRVGVTAADECIGFNASDLALADVAADDAFSDGVSRDATSRGLVDGDRHRCWFAGRTGGMGFLSVLTGAAGMELQPDTSGICVGSNNRLPIGRDGVGEFDQSDD